MSKIDLNYLCTLIGNLSGVPIRMFRGGKQLFFHSFVNLPRDPMLPFRDDILSKDAHISYYITPYFHYYGIVSDGKTEIVVGPSMLTAGNEHDLRELAMRCDVPHEETDAFITGMNSIVRMPLTSIMLMLCAINYVLNDEKKSLKEITIYEAEQQALTAKIGSERAEQAFDTFNDALESENAVHNTLAAEQTIMNFVRKGDVDALKKWAAAAPAIRAGVMAGDQLRQLKNTFIVTATLVARAAIRGGMDVNDALSLSDSYIRKCELLTAEDRIVNMQFHMILDYTERVEKLHVGSRDSKFVLEVAGFVQKHISEPISTDDIADALFLSRSRLSTRFKAETGKNLSDYISEERIEEAKRLLVYTDKSLAAISAYLCFSSQSHFSRTFKKFTGRTPADYRNSMRA